MDKLCVISMSGGLDSTTLAFKAIEDGFTILPINIEYGQKNIVELQAFSNIIRFLQLKFSEQVLDPVHLNLAEMMKQSAELYQRLRDSHQVKHATGHEFYTPSRNLVFSTLAAMIGEIAAIAEELTEVKVGLGIHAHSDVYERDYWDITPQFVEKLNAVFALNDSMDIGIYAPYSNVLKSEIVKDAIRLQVPYDLTWTCYNPVKKELLTTIKYTPCLKCEACQERARAGEQAKIYDINQYSLEIKKDFK